MVVRPTLAGLVLTLLALLDGCRPSSEVAPPITTAAIPSADLKSGHELAFRLGHTSSSTSLYEQDAQAFLALVAQRTKGAVHGQSFPAGQLANQQEMLEQVQLGSLDMVIAGSETSSAVPEFGILDLPFLFADRAAAEGRARSAAGCRARPAGR